MRKVLALVVVVLLVAPALRAQTPDPATATILAKIAALEQELTILKAQLQERAAAAPRPSSLAEASAEAVKIKHEWPASTNTYSNATLKEESSTSPSRSAGKAEADALTDAAPPTRTEQDKMRTEAAALFRSRVEDIRQAQSDLVGARTQYASACANKSTVAMRTVVGPFGSVFHIPEVTLNETTPTCRVIGTDIGRLVNRIVSTAEDVRETARTRGIWPGIVREILDPVLASR